MALALTSTIIALRKSIWVSRDTKIGREVPVDAIFSCQENTELEALRCFEIVLLSTGLEKTLVSDKGQLNTILGGTHRRPTRFSWSLFCSGFLAKLLAADLKRSGFGNYYVHQSARVPVKYLVEFGGNSMIVNHNESFDDRTWFDRLAQLKSHYLSPKKIDLGGQPSKITLERARVRSVFTQSPSLCLAPWDIWKSLKYWNHAKFIQLQQLIPNHLKPILKFGRNPQGCMQSPQGKAPCFKLSADGTQLADFAFADVFRRCIRRRRKLQNDWNLLDMRSIFSSYFGVSPSESQVSWFGRYFPMAPLLLQRGSFHCTFWSRLGLHLARSIGDYPSAN